MDSPAVAAQGRALTRRLAQEPGATQVTSYWTGQAAPLRSRDGRQALVLARITGDERTDELVARYEHDGTATRVQAGGQLRVYREVNTQVESDLAKAEGIAVPITLLLLLVVVVFASAVAALLPLAVGGFAIVGTLLILRVLAGLTDVSVYALNLTTALGLGLAVDYSLLSSRATASSCAPAASRPTPWRSPCRPPAAPCCSAPSPSPRRCWR